MVSKFIRCVAAALAIQGLAPARGAAQEARTSEALGAPVSRALSHEERAQYERVLAYLGKADLLRFVAGAVVPHGRKASFHVTFKFATDDQSQAGILTILRNRTIFNIGQMGSAHAKDVGAAVRADAYDFRSFNGVLGPESLELMINAKSFWGYADIDRYDLYGGFAPASAHIILEFLPDKVMRTLFRRPSE
jgi:hypothetical protein